jgi:acetyl esterase/lipase
MWDAFSNRFGWTSYLGSADPEVAAPARRTDLSALPPAWIGVGTHDLFLDEDRAYAERLRTAGVPCALHIVDGAFHGFDSVAARTGVARGFFDEQCAALENALCLKRS